MADGKTMNDLLSPLVEELSLWRSLDLTPEFWWRDDDATHHCSELDPLIELAHNLAIPCILAVIPASFSETLSGKIAHDNFITPVQHGYSHQNHATEHEKKQELGNHRPLSDVEAEILQGFSDLKKSFPRFFPVMVPPWNRMHESVAEQLEDMGFRGVSTFAAQRFDRAPKQINVHIDIIDWRGSRRQKPLDVIVAELVANLRQKRENPNSDLCATGIMTHHKDQSREDWTVLHLLFQTILDQGGVFRDAPELFG